jgi:ubiquinone/menaquinone biosynthesis C-methylase UbiE
VGKVDYDERQHAVYAAGRQMSPGALQTWMKAFANHLPQTRPLVWLDLGSGIGRITPSLASTFGGPVYGVEPADKMRAQAIGHAEHPAVTYAAGSAEHVPLPDFSCDAALLFFVWHHVVDRDSAARELSRVVKKGGKVFVQANFSDRRPDAWWLHVVPEWMNVHQALYQSEEDVISDFAGAGWTLASHDEVTWLRSPSLVEDFQRLRLRPTSLFEHLSEEQIEAGFARIEAALPSLDDGPQFETSALLVFRREERRSWPRTPGRWDTPAHRGQGSPRKSGGLWVGEITQNLK